MSMARRKQISKSFRHGFREGFGAPASLFQRMNYNRVLVIDSSVEAAWKSVADALNSATSAVGGDISERYSGGGIIGQGSRENFFIRG